MPKQTVTIRVEENLLEWVRARCETGGPFGSVSHAVEQGLRLLKEEREYVEDLLRETHKEKK